MKTTNYVNAHYFNWLRYYLNSPFFKECAETFFETTRHTHEPVNNDSHPNSQSYFIGHDSCAYYSEIYIEYFKRISTMSGSHAHMLNYVASDLYPYYFTKKSTEKQLFSFVFSIWWGMSEEQIHAIHLSSDADAWSALNYFLCNPLSQCLPNGTIHCVYSGQYYRFKPGAALLSTDSELVKAPQWILETEHK